MNAALQQRIHKSDRMRLGRAHARTTMALRGYGHLPLEAATYDVNAGVVSVRCANCGCEAAATNQQIVTWPPKLRGRQRHG